LVLIPGATEETQLYVQVLDISERKRAERALQAANADLETRNREVEALASMQRDFVGASSHELRTPLTSILGYLDIVLDESELLHEEHLGHIEIAHRSGRRLLALVEDLVTVNRVDTDNLALVRSPTGLGGLLQGIEEVFAPICAGRDIRLAIEHVGAVAVDIDRIRTEQIFANLVGNAVKFTAPGGLIRVRVVVDDDHAAVDVIDSGVGISAEDLERVFDRFYRAPSAQRNAVPGTGLGLTIAQALAEAQGGWLAATSTPGLGSTFTAYLPLAKEQPWHASSSSTTTLTS
jgi:signal transduction histidine kinase